MPAPRYIKGKDGKFQGSIGDGKTNIPTASNQPSVISSQHAIDMPGYATAWERYITERDSRKNIPSQITQPKVSDTFPRRPLPAKYDNAHEYERYLQTNRYYDKAEQVHSLLDALVLDNVQWNEHGVALKFKKSANGVVSILGKSEMSGTIEPFDDTRAGVKYSWAATVKDNLGTIEQNRIFETKEEALTWAAARVRASGEELAAYSEVVAQHGENSGDVFLSEIERTGERYREREEPWGNAPPIVYADLGFRQGIVDWNHQYSCFTAQVSESSPVHSKRALATVYNRKYENKEDAITFMRGMLLMGLAERETNFGDWTP